MNTRLEEKYQQSVLPQLSKEFGLSNPHQVPTITKVVINVGVGRAAGDSKTQDTVVNTLRKITGQQPLETKAKGSVAGFKLRKGQKIGLKVTLRSGRMWDFLDRLLSLVLPRTRDFHGLPRQAFDREGNYSIGITDQSVFPELTYEETSLIHGLQINIVTSTQSQELSARLLELLGFPLQKTHQVAGGDIKERADKPAASTAAQEGSLAKTLDNHEANNAEPAAVVLSKESIGGQNG